MALHFKFSPQRRILHFPVVEEEQDRLFAWDGEDEDVVASGFRFGSTILCVAPQPRTALASQTLTLTHVSSGTSRAINAHTRLVRLTLSDDDDDRDASYHWHHRPSQSGHATSSRGEDDETTLLAMLLEDTELADAFPDLSARFTLQAPVGSSVAIHGSARTSMGQIIHRERLKGNFRYVVSISNGREFEGAPVFLEEDLIGVVVRGTPGGFAIVLGLEPIVSRTSPSSFFAQNQARTSYRDAVRSLLPDSRTRQDIVRERLNKLRLFVDESDFQMI